MNLDSSSVLGNSWDEVAILCFRVGVYLCVCVCVCVCVTSEISWLPWYRPVPAKSQVKRRFPLPWSLSCQQHWKFLDLASGFWQSSMMSVSVWLTATRSMMLLCWITLCLLVWLFIYLDLCFHPDGPWCFYEKGAYGWRRYFPKLFLLKLHPRTLVQPGTQKPPPASLFSLKQHKAACQL